MPDHTTNALDCWCGPEYKVPCSECDSVPDCWKCGGTGFTMITRADVQAQVTPVLIVHRDG